MEAIKKVVTKFMHNFKLSSLFNFRSISPFKMSVSNTFRALVTRAKKTPATVESLKRSGK